MYCVCVCIDVYVCVFRECVITDRLDCTPRGSLLWAGGLCAGDAHQGGRLPCGARPRAAAAGKGHLGTQQSPEVPTRPPRNMSPALQ